MLWLSKLPDWTGTSLPQLSLKLEFAACMHSLTQDHSWIYKAWEKTAEIEVLCSSPTLSCRAQGYSLALASVNLVGLKSPSDESSEWESASLVWLGCAKKEDL